MNKLIVVAEYFISVAKEQKAVLGEQIADKLEIGNTNTEFQQLFSHRQQLKQVIIGLEQVQRHLRATKQPKTVKPRQAKAAAKSLRKEIIELWRCTDEADVATRRPLDLAWQFVVDESTRNTTGEHIGLGIFDDPMPEPVEAH